MGQKLLSATKEKQNKKKQTTKQIFQIMRKIQLTTWRYKQKNDGWDYLIRLGYIEYK